MDYVLEWLKEHDLPTTVENYLALAYLGDVKTLEQLAEGYPEDYAVLLEMIEAGLVTKN